ncbi:hypothetical protein [Aeromicrobium fastidiosum]|uniref:Uncharacterized protein n=1 Tax=Aeromicrobium fastidiosum TaxID=52699 RepID=A0A641AM37_9ACTN|nr:hypothetical protein [Aeromicrobium fastidiosum]KAA1376338.1 hypothetical protein ESP62_012960 [Aeromicrobium fastidiosum]MBP2391762.1 hypothetical protein [Aeromicrobium fastidiosum]
MTHDDTNHGWTDDHGPALRAAAPEVPQLTPEHESELWQQIECAGRQPVVRRTRRWRTVVAGIVAVGAVGVAGAATANVLSAHTGRFASDAEDLELGGPGERIDPAAPDFATVLDGATRDIHFPSLWTRANALSWEVGDLSDEDTVVSMGALRLWIASHAVCSWTDRWAAALRTGDEPAEDEAAAVILSARTWPSITDTDDELANESEASWLPVLERAVRSEQPSAAAAALNGQACMPGLAPELGYDPRW